MTPAVAHRGEVAHLGEGEEALVARVLSRHAVEEVDALRRRQALEVEVGEAPEMEALGEHRVDAAAQALFRETAGGIAAEGQVAHGVHQPGRSRPMVTLSTVGGQMPPR